jgi:transcription elongation factor Elf1
MANSKRERELLNMAGLAKHLGITKVRVHTLCKEKRLKPDYEINGRYLWKPSTAEKLKEAFKGPGVKGKPKVLELKKNRNTIAKNNHNPQAMPAESSENVIPDPVEPAVVPETEKGVAPVTISDIETDDRKPQEGKKIIMMNVQNSNNHMIVSTYPERKNEEMQIQIVEERKYRWQCPNCSHKNSPDAYKKDKSLTTEMTCWACGLTIKFNEEQKSWRVTTSEVQINVTEERKFRWECRKCGSSNGPSAYQRDGSLKTELRCWVCNLIIRLDDKEKAWHVITQNQSTDIREPESIKEIPK